MRDDEACEDSILDIVNALGKSGVPMHDRPEHVDRKFYLAAHREAVSAIQLGRPWVASVTRTCSITSRRSRQSDSERTWGWRLAPLSAASSPRLPSSSDTCKHGETSTLL